MKGIYTEDALQLFELVAAWNLGALNSKRASTADTLRHSKHLLQALNFRLQAERAATRAANAKAKDVARLAALKRQTLAATKHNLAEAQKTVN